MFYVFDQNNTGGSWSGPALHVVIEADSPAEANAIAPGVGIYFDDEYKIDCECCGTRWYRQWETDQYEIGFKTLEEAIKDADRESIVGNGGYPNYIVHRKYEEAKNG